MKFFLIYILLLVFFPVYSSDTKKEVSHRKREIKAGILLLSPDELNDELVKLGHVKASNQAYQLYIGEWFTAGKLTMGAGLTGLFSENTENNKSSYLHALGPSLEVGYRVFGTKLTGFSPFVGMSYKFASFRIMQNISNGSLASVYNSQHVDRKFHRQELNLSLGMSFRISIGSKHAIGVQGGYHFCTFDNKWKYGGEKIDFPSMNLSGWQANVFYCF